MKCLLSRSFSNSNLSDSKQASSSRSIGSSSITGSFETHDSSTSSAPAAAPRGVGGLGVSGPDACNGGSLLVPAWPPQRLAPAVMPCLAPSWVAVPPGQNSSMNHSPPSTVVRSSLSDSSVTSTSESYACFLPVHASNYGHVLPACSSSDAPDTLT